MTSGPFAVRHEVRMQDQKGDPAEVIAVQVRQDDGVDGVGVDAQRVDADQGGGAEIDEIASAFRFQMEAGVAPAHRCRTRHRIRRS